jgi:hypothetical protein
MLHICLICKYIFFCSLLKHILAYATIAFSERCGHNLINCHHSIFEKHDVRASVDMITVHFTDELMNRVKIVASGKLFRSSSLRCAISGAQMSLLC